ncbi:MULTISPECIES: ABC transporter permease [Halomonadaceae]|uniref:ABC transporter permease subunit n=1 Tax=Vreelandella halophila TaxID=86177 RepID=A0A9X4YB66_9GAMM|nr:MULTISPECIES: ABC transporter permease [Halomonas]MYL26055.1 ABC transporter permease subunit [Halomonas utahensis]MYL73383.1 ABC transporter permease subunit [Halomonas sp. 22501_18_FS]
MTATTTTPATAGGVEIGHYARRISENLGYPLLGLAILLGFWWLGGYLIASNPSTQAFSAFAPESALPRAWELLWSGTLWDTVHPSLSRIGLGLFWATLVAVPVGILVGSLPVMQKITSFPFQLLRMVSPLAWMPIAVLAFETWDGAIVFLLFMASVWPILFSTAFAVQRIDPMYFKVARNFGASPLASLRRLVIPAVAPDILAGFRLALGIAWVVLVPAEYLGVTSGLGYAINDARDILAYDLLAALVLVIGVIGYVLDAIVVALIRYVGWQGT